MVETLAPCSERVPRTLRLTRTSSPTTLDAYHEAWDFRRVVAATAHTSLGWCVLYWQAPTILNPHFAAGTKDREASRIVYEPLFSVNPEGDFVPILAAEIPSVANGGRAPDGTWTIWRLKQGVVWHDGAPFTADDVVFTWEYATDPATAATTRGSYEQIHRIDKLDDHTIKVVFTEPT